MSECSLCDGTLQIIVATSGGYTGDATRAEDPPQPCPRCLSIPATPELRAFAREWLGFDPWRDTNGTIGRPWWRSFTAYAPLYLPAGPAVLRALEERRVASGCTDDDRRPRGGRRRAEGAAPCEGCGAVRPGGAR